MNPLMKETMDKVRENMRKEFLERNPLIAELERQKITQEEFLTWLKSESLYQVLRSEDKRPRVCDAEPQNYQSDLYDFICSIRGV